MKHNKPTRRLSWARDAWILKTARPRSQRLKATRMVVS